MGELKLMHASFATRLAVKKPDTGGYQFTPDHLLYSFLVYEGTLSFTASVTYLS